MRTIYLLTLAALAVALAHPVAAAVDTTEFWINDQQGWVVETKPCDSGLCGYLVDFPSAHTLRPDGPEKDVHNPNPARRAEPICGLLLMGGFRPSKPDGTGWEDGWVYDPDSGSTYSGKISVVSADTITLRGYIGISLLGKTLNLHRAAGAPARCSPAGG